MINHRGTYQHTVTADVTLQTYRDDNGAHLVIMLPAETRTITIELSDGECERLEHSFASIKQEAPF